MSLITHYIREKGCTPTIVPSIFAVAPRYIITESKDQIIKYPAHLFIDSSTETFNKIKYAVLAPGSPFIKKNALFQNA